MNGIIIDWDKVSKGGDVDLLNTYYAFLCIVAEIEAGALVEDLKLKNGSEDIVTEEGFREFLKVIVSVPWKEAELTTGQIAGLNSISDYLIIDYNQGEQPIQAGGITIAELTDLYDGNGNGNGGGNGNGNGNG